MLSDKVATFLEDGWDAQLSIVFAVCTGLGQDHDAVAYCAAELDRTLASSPPKKSSRPTSRSRTSSYLVRGMPDNH